MKSTTKSSQLTMKKSGHAVSKPRKMRQLMFSPTEEVPIATRDYGLMWTAKQSLTPFPRVDVGVDANLLKARLSMRRHIEMTRMSEMVDNKLGKAVTPKTPKNAQSSPSQKIVNMDRPLAATPSSIKNMLSLGTPHPTKGVAINAKILAKRLTDMNEDLKKPTTPSIPSKISQTSRKKVVRLMSTATVNTVNRLFTSLDCERLSDISQRVTQLDYSVSGSQQSVDSMKNDLSFAERRRIFDEGEFTISRYGKKMTEVMMASDPLQHKVVEQGTNFAKKANDEIEKYIRTQGLIKTSHDQLKWTRQFDWGSSSTSTDSVYQRPQKSMADIYRDIKKRKYVRSQTHRD